MSVAAGGPESPNCKLNLIQNGVYISVEVSFYIMYISFVLGSLSFDENLANEKDIFSKIPKI